jgi:hypothetical protein
METKFLISHKLRTLGAVLFILGILGTSLAISDYEPEFLDVNVIMLFADDEVFGQEDFSVIDVREENIFNELVGIFVILGGLLLLLARRKHEDEMMIKLRLESVLWAAKINAVLLIISILFIYGLSFYFVMVFNLGILYALFALRFEWAVSQLKRE